MTLLKSLQTIVNYLWDDEMRNWEEEHGEFTEDNVPDSDNHIFYHVYRINKWLCGGVGGKFVWELLSKMSEKELTEMVRSYATSRKTHNL